MNTLNPLQRQFVAATSAVSVNDAYVLSGSTVTTTALASGVGVVSTSNATTAKVVFCGTGADNSTINFKLYARIFTSNISDTVDAPCAYLYMGSGVATLGTLTFTTTSLGISGTYRVADTITWTAADPFSTLATENSASTGTAYSPADNTPAYIFFSYLGGATELVADTDLGTATGALVYIQPGTV